VSSLLELACGRACVVDPDGDSETGTETGAREEVDSKTDSGISRGSRVEIGGGSRAGIVGGLGGVKVRAGVTTSKNSARGSV